MSNLDEIIVTPDTLKTMKETLDAMKRVMVEEALVRCHGNKTHAAKMIGIAKRSMRNYIIEFGLTQYRGTVPGSQVRGAKCPK